METGFEKKYVYRINPTDPTSARVNLREAHLQRHGKGWDTYVDAQSALTSTETEFLVEATLKVYEAGKPFFVKSWFERIPRKHV